VVFSHFHNSRLNHHHHFQPKKWLSLLPIKMSQKRNTGGSQIAW
jgi:hypothetical protein